MWENIPFVNIPPFIVKDVSMSEIRTRVKELLEPVTLWNAILRLTNHWKPQVFVVPPEGGMTMLRAYEIGHVTPEAINFVVLSMLRDIEQWTPEKPLTETLEEMVRRFDLYNGAIERGFTPPIWKPK